MSDSSPRVLAVPGVHEAVFAQVAALPRGRVLDMPCGQGALTQQLVEAGYDVTSADVEPDGFRLPQRTCDAVDFDAPLPYADGTFDIVVCVEGIEHCENQYQLFRELRRILRDGGHLVLSTPNVMSLSARMRWLLTGFDDVSPRPIRHDEARLSYHHINPVGVSFLELMCRANGMKIESITTNRIRKGSVALGALLLPWIWLATHSVLRGRNRPAPMPEVHAEVRGWLLSTPVLFGRVIVIHAVVTDH